MMIRILQVVFGVFMVGFAIALAVTLFLIFDPEVKPFSLFVPAYPPAVRAAGAAFLPRGAGEIAGQKAEPAKIPDTLAAWLDAN